MIDSGRLETQIYQNRGQTWNFGGPQSGPDLDDREESHIATIWPTNDRSNMGRYDGRKNSKFDPDPGITGAGISLTSNQVEKCEA